MNTRKLIISFVSGFLCFALVVCAIAFVPDIVKTQKSMSKYKEMSESVATGDYKAAISILPDAFDMVGISKKVSFDDIYTNVLQIFALAINDGDFDSAWQIIEWLSDYRVFPNIHKNPRIYPNMVSSDLQNYFEAVSFTNEEKYEAYMKFVTEKFVELYNNNSSLYVVYTEPETKITPTCEREFSHLLWMYTLLPSTNENRKSAEAIIAAILENTFVDNNRLQNDLKRDIMAPLIEDVEQYSNTYVYNKVKSETKFFERLPK